MQMADKNARLAKENTTLKETLNKNISKQETLLKTTIKAEYFENVTFKSTIQTIDENIRCIEECLAACKKIKETIVASHGRTKVKRPGIKELPINTTRTKKEQTKSKTKQRNDENMKRLKLHKK